MNDLEKQLKQLAKKIEKEASMSLSPNELFSKDFMRQNHIHKTIQEIFDDANVNIENIMNLSNDEKDRLLKSISSSKFKSWDDFINSAGEFQVAKKLKSIKL